MDEIYSLKNISKKYMFIINVRTLIILTIFFMKNIIRKMTTNSIYTLKADTSIN